MSDADNPYLPPKAPIADLEPDASTGRPISVWIAVILITLLVAQDAMTLVRTVAAVVERGDELFIPIVLHGILLLGEIGSAIYLARGRNWARFLFLLIMILELALSAAMLMVASRLAPERFSAVFDWRYFASTAVPHALAIAALVLVFGPGRGWFRKRS